MTELIPWAQWLLAGVGLYGALGLVFAVFFVLRGVGVLDPAAQHAPLGVRLLLLPGSLALWPLLALRWRRAARVRRREPHG